MRQKPAKNWSRAAQEIRRSLVTASATSGRMEPSSGPPQMTRSGCRSCEASVREIARGCRTTLFDGLAGQAHTVRTWPASWTICMPRQDRANMEAIRMHLVAGAVIETIEATGP